MLSWKSFIKDFWNKRLYGWVIRWETFLIIWRVILWNSWFFSIIRASRNTFNTFWWIAIIGVKNKAYPNSLYHLLSCWIETVGAFFRFSDLFENLFSCTSRNNYLYQVSIEYILKMKEQSVEFLLSVAYWNSKLRLPVLFICWSGCRARFHGRSFSTPYFSF